MKRILSITSSVLIASVLVLSGCSSNNAATKDSMSSGTQESPQASVIGVWKQTNSADPTRHMSAIVTENTIRVYWPADSANGPFLYWAGSFDAAKAATGSTVTSALDEAATATEFMASRDNAKDFIVDGDTLSFGGAIQGQNFTIEMKRESEEVPTETAVHNSDAANSFSNNTLETAKVKISITSSRIIPAGETGNQFGTKPVIAFYYDMTNKTDEDITATDWVLYFTAYQDNDPNVLNELDMASSPDLVPVNSSLEKIKKGGTVRSAVAYDLDDQTTPVKLVAHDFGADAEIGSVEFPSS